MESSDVNSPIKSRTWRIIHFPLITLILGIASIAAAGALFQFTVVQAINSFGPQGPALNVLVSAGGAASIICGYLLFNRWIERRPNIEFALPGAGRELLYGVGAGILLFSTVVAIIAVAGGYRIAGWNTATILFPALSLGIVSAFLEETLFRGLIFRITEQWLGSWTSLAISAVLFGLLHIGNSNSGILPAAAIALEAGIMLAAVYMYTRRLWAAIGLHGGWNFAQGGLYGINVSGIDQKGLIHPNIQGPEWLTGGPFGAEASVPALLVCTAFGLWLLVRCYRSKKFVPFQSFWGNSSGHIISDSPQ